jgi:hypothetical protein
LGPAVQIKLPWKTQSHLELHCWTKRICNTCPDFPPKSDFRAFSLHVRVHINNLAWRSSDAAIGKGARMQCPFLHDPKKVGARPLVYQIEGNKKSASSKSFPAKGICYNCVSVWDLLPSYRLFSCGGQERIPYLNLNRQSVLVLICKGPS